MAQNPTFGHAPTLPGVSRRSLLRAAPALLAPALLASPALAAAGEDPDTPVLALFRAWDALHADLETIPDEEVEAAAERLHAMERRILAEPATGLRDLAAKVVASSCYGDFPVEAVVVAECEALLAGGAA